MIRRLVKLTFREECLADFFILFEKNKALIKAQPGCFELKMLRDQRNPQIVFTSSLWSNEETLNQYRDSEVFKTIWPVTKSMFAAKPEAWSCDEILI